jgi:hypothetical protein
MSEEVFEIDPQDEEEVPLEGESPEVDDEVEDFALYQADDETHEEFSF